MPISEEERTGRFEEIVDDVYKHLGELAVLDALLWYFVIRLAKRNDELERKLENLETWRSLSKNTKKENVRRNVWVTQ